MSIEIVVNGDARDVPAETTIEQLLDTLGAPGGGRGVAVALDGVVVPRGEWTSTVLPAGAAVEIVVAVQGG
jgi:sulfur carrier protein